MLHSTYTQWGTHGIFRIHNTDTFCTRSACSIPDPSSSSVVVTGGSDGHHAGVDTVSRYGSGGWLEDLPHLTVGRQYHGCGGYAGRGGLVSTEYLGAGDL